MTLPPMDLVVWYAARTPGVPLNDDGLLARIQEQVDARLPLLTWRPDDDGAPRPLDVALDLAARSIGGLYPEASDG